MYLHKPPRALGSASSPRTYQSACRIMWRRQQHPCSMLLQGCAAIAHGMFAASSARCSMHAARHAAGTCQESKHRCLLGCRVQKLLRGKHSPGIPAAAAHSRCQQLDHLAPQCLLLGRSGLPAAVHCAAAHAYFGQLNVPLNCKAAKICKAATTLHCTPEAQLYNLAVHPVCCCTQTLPVAVHKHRLLYTQTVYRCT